MFIEKLKVSSMFRQQKFKISELKFLAKETATFRKLVTTLWGST